MKKLFFLLLIGPLLAGVWSCQPEEPQALAPIDGLPDFSQHPKQAFYQNELENYRRQHGAPGGIMLVKTPANGLWIGGAGSPNLAHAGTMTGSERIRVGSITKPFTAALIFKLKEQGKLSLDSKLGDLLPQVNGQIPQADRITVQQLLTHTSGIRNVGDDNMAYKLALLNRPADADMAKPEHILKQFIYGKPLDFEPGSQHQYGNTTFMLLGMIAEKLAGKPLSVQMQELIFTPLQMTNTYLEKGPDPAVVRDYFDLYGNGKLMDVSEWETTQDGGGAAGGLVTTVSDLLKFSEGLFGGKLLTAQSLAEMTASVKLPSCDNGDCEYGQGLSAWQWNGKQTHGHTGGIIGLDAYWLYFPAQQSTIIVFLNKGVPTDKSLVDRVLFES